MTHANDAVAIDVLVCLVTVMLGAAYLGHFAWRQWLPWDDGTMAQMAERALHGQLPHRDFNEPYTGGLTWLHMTAFRFLGVSIWTLRTTLFGFAVASIPIWYYVARRFASPLVAAVITLTCVAWSLPNYAAPLPSWYNLFFAMAALAAMLRYLEKRTLRWIFVAGVAIGLSILVKITGVYLAAAVAVFLAFDSTTRAETVARPNAGQPLLAAGLLFMTFAFAIAPLVLTLAAHDSSSLNSVAALGLPPSLVAGAVSLTIGRRWRGSWRPRVSDLWRLLLLAAGAALVLLLFSIPYIESHATGALIRGVFLRAQLRLQIRSASAPAPDLLWVGFSVPVVYACVRGPRDDRARASFVWLLLAFWILADAAAFSRLPGAFLWLSVRMLMLPLTGVVAWLVWRLSDSAEGPTLRSKQLLLVTSVAAWCSLVQFPFTYRTYFAYVAPLVILAAVALAAENRRPAPILRLVALMGYCVLAVIMRPRIYPERDVEPGPLATLLPPRGGILVPPSDARRYGGVVALLSEHSRSGFTLATPDAPEVYFLSGLDNPTRSLFESFDYPPNNPLDVLKRIDEHAITAVVINHRPQFSAPLSAALEDSLERRFPEAQPFGNLEVRWRSPDHK